MATRAIKVFLAWSYSRLDDYLGCPRKAMYKHLWKLPQPAAPQLERGSDIHKKAELYTTGQLKKMPAELKLFTVEFRALLKMKSKLMVEQELAFDAKWAQVDWFSPYVYVRIKMDCMYDESNTIRVVIDYKTGHVNPKHKDQLELYAIAAFLTAPAATERVDTKLWYLDEGLPVEQTFMRAELPALQKKWEKKALPMLRDKKFKATPGDACKWCAQAKKKGGPCEY